MTTTQRSITTTALLLALSSVAACDMADRDERFRPFAGTGGTSGNGGEGGIGGSMDSSVPMDAGSDDDSGDSGEGGSGGNAGMDAGHDASVPPPPYTAMGLLTASGQCAIGVYSEFESLAELLVQATETQAQSPSADNLRAAQDAWIAAMAAWQRAELFRFGPAAPRTEAGGQDLRAQIYYFPTINRCLIDQQLVNQRYAQDNYATAQASSRGLAAIEYLLFHEGEGNACGAQVSINAQGTWATLSPTELTQRRADYAHAAATDVLGRVRALIAAWEPSGENFIAQWSAPGGSSAFASEQEALSALVVALYFMERDIKDSKLSVPLSIPLGGLTECPNAPATCPDLLESRYARVSADNIRQNLIAFRQVFQGCGPGFSGLGVDDWLRSIGHQDLVDELIAALDAADAAVDAVQPSLETVVAQSEQTSARNLHAAIKAITDLFKTQLVMALNVTLPGGAGGDAD